jgi:hypothetical protein
MIHTTIIISVVAVANTSTFAYFLRQAKKKRNPKHFCCHVDPATTSSREERVLHPPNEKVRKASARSRYSAGKEKRRGKYCGERSKKARRKEGRR